MGEGPAGGIAPDACPACGSPLSGGTCQACSARESIDKAIEEAERQIERGKQAGADMSEAEDLLAGARLMCEGGSNADAKQLLDACAEMAKETALQFDVLVNSIRRSQALIEGADEVGGDTAEASRMLNLAREALADRDYKRGISYALRSRDLAERERRRYESWQVEVGSWMKK